MKLPDLEAIETAAGLVYESLQASPQISWPLLNKRCGLEVWVKHENHNPTGTFKVRGGLIYVRRLVERDASGTGLCSATRGNHGQSVAFAASKYGLASVIVVPEGNSPDKNASMRAFGAELVEYGRDFDTALERAKEIATERGLHFMPSIDGDLVVGVATYAWEFFSKAPPLDRVYVPLGLGSGICGVIAARNALGLDTRIIGVVAANANTYQLSFAAGRVVPTNSADTIADGLAVRNPSPEVLALLQAEVEDIIAVEEEEIMAAIGCYFTDTHNVAEGAGAASLAGLLKDRGRQQERVGVILSGGNIQHSLFTQAISSQCG